MLVAAGAALLGGAECTSVSPPYGISPHPPAPDASTDAVDAAPAEAAADVNAGDQSNQGEDATDGGDH
jgi:hypothetical protein